jgi:hypothetical protein
MTFPDTACKRHKPQNKKATQNKLFNPANSTAFLLPDNKHLLLQEPMKLHLVGANGKSM